MRQDLPRPGADLSLLRPRAPGAAFPRPAGAGIDAADDATTRPEARRPMTRRFPIRALPRARRRAVPA
jgi:hypothetical protein